jgi:hypothetical protein
MNVALSAVIISILLIHPLIFYVSLFLGKYPKAAGLLLYFECRNDELDRIHLQNVTRRPFQKTEVPTSITGEVPGEKLSVPGNVMSFDYSNIININLRFITIENTLAEINNLA